MASDHEESHQLHYYGDGMYHRLLDTDIKFILKTNVIINNY